LPLHVCLPTVQQVKNWKIPKWFFMKFDIEDFKEIYRQIKILFVFFYLSGCTMFPHLPAPI